MGPRASRGRGRGLASSIIGSGMVPDGRAVADLRRTHRRFAKCAQHMHERVRCAS
jgi:hypothetical protein